MNKTLEEMLDECIEQMRSGRSMDDVLSAYPGVAAELRPLLEVAAGLSDLPEPEVSVKGLMQALSRQSALRRRERPAKKPLRISFFSVPMLARVAAGIAVVLFIGWGVSVASAQTVPGDFLYPLKLLTERVKFFLTVNSEDKAELRIVFSSERLREAIAQHERDGTLDPELLKQMLEEARQAVELSADLPETRRELLVAQTVHLSRFQAQALGRFKQELPSEQQAVVTPYIDMCDRRANWMQGMCGDWWGSTNAAPSQPSQRQWMDTCPWMN